jgi:CAAX prenyl protease-like protein
MSYDLRAALGWITAIAVILSVISYALSLFVSVAVVTTTQLGSQMSTMSGQLYIEAFLLIFLTPIQANVLALVVISLIIFFVCFIKAATANGGFRSGLRILTTGRTPQALPNWLAVMPLVASALLIISLLLSLVQDIFGVATGSLGTTDPTVLFPSLALAPIAEEIGFRISVLGLVAAILVAVKFGNNVAHGAKIMSSRQLATFFSAFISPGYAKERVGLPSIRTSGLKGISISEWIFLFLTSIVFGAYHVFGGAGWGPGKFLTAALTGFALGIVYLAYGAYADILLHWFFDLNFYTFDPSVYPAFNGAFSTFGDLYTLGAIALGVWAIIVGVYWYSKRNSPSVAPSTIHAW